MKFRFNHRRAQVSLPALAGCAGLTVLYKFPPSQYQIYPRCPFYAVTHLLCPGCGGTRAMYELLHMNLPGALHYNALVTVLAPLALIWLAWGCYRLYRYDRFPPVPWPRSIALALGVVAVLFAFVRDAGIAFVI
jgi:Protein of unknown function (DUF2752)